MVEAIGGLWIQHGGGVGGGKMTKGEENPLWARTWASEPCFFHEIREHVVACMFEISTSTSPLFTLHFPSFVNLKQKHQKTPSRQSAIENLGVGKQECKMRKTISNGRWESPSFLGVWCCNFHPNIVKHACKTKSIWHKPQGPYLEPLHYQ